MNLSIQKDKTKNIMIKLTTFFTLILVVLLVFTSCKKEIELNVAQATPKLVVEAIVTDSENSYVRITKSKSIYDNEESEAINDADVSISDDQGNTFLFNNINSFGYYALDGFIGIPGRTYTLDIDANGLHITGVDKMLPHVDLEAITFRNIPISDDAEKQVLCHFQDDGATEDYYYFKVIETPSPTPFGSYNTSRSDLLFNGLTTEVVMDRFFTLPGTTLNVYLYHVNKENYKYLYTLSSISGDGPFGGGSPGNPINTIDGDAIGFFGAWPESSIEIVVP